MHKENTVYSELLLVELSHDIVLAGGSSEEKLLGIAQDWLKQEPDALLAIYERRAVLE